MFNVHYIIFLSSKAPKLLRLSKKNIYFKLGTEPWMLEMPDPSILDTFCNCTSRHLPSLPGISGSWACRSFIPRGFQVERSGTLPHKGRGKLLPLGFFWRCVGWSDLIGERMTGPTFGAILIECRCCKNYWLHHEWRVAIGRNIKGLNIELNLRNRLGVWYITCKVGGEIIPKKIQVSKGSLLRGHQIPLHANTWELHHLPSSKIYCYQISNFVMFFCSICRCSICSIAIFFIEWTFMVAVSWGRKNTSCVHSLGAGLASSRDCLLRSKTPLQYTAGCGCLHLSLCLDLIKSQIAKKNKQKHGGWP